MHHSPRARAIRFACTLFLAMVTSLAHRAATAQDYPTGPITVVQPYAAGGAAEIYARLVAEGIRTALNQPVIVVAKPGAGGLIGGEFVAKVKPDGYTLLIATSSYAIFHLGKKDMPFNLLTDFEPISLSSFGPAFAIWTHPSVPAKTVPEFVAYAKANPNKLNFGSTGFGTPGIITSEFMRRTGTQMRDIPYKGAAETSLALQRGDIHFSADIATSLKAQFDAGKVTALAVLSKERDPLLPGVPNAAEAGMPGFEASVWYLWLAPPGTPRAIINKLNGAINAALRNPQLRTTIRDRFGGTVLGLSPEDTRKFMQDEVAKWKTIADGLGIKPE